MILNNILFDIIKTFIDSKTVLKKNLITSWNQLSYWLINATCIGCVLVGNFRFNDGTLSTGLHIFGSIIAFIAPIPVIYLHYRIALEMNHSNISMLRKILLIAYCTSVVTFLSVEFLFLINVVPEIVLNFNIRQNWHPGQPYHSVHVFCSTLEWLIVMMLGLFFLTFPPQVEKYELKNNLIRSK